MKRITKIVAMCLAFCLMFMTFCKNVNAASGSISISNKSANVGSNVTVTCTIKCSTGAIGSADVTLTYDPAALKFVSATNMAQGGNGGVHYVGATSDFTSSSLSFSMTFTVLKAGSHKVSVSNAIVYDVDEQMFSPGGSGTITGKAPSSNTGGGSNNTGGGSNNSTVKKDTNNKLSGLQVYPGSLTPAFNAATTAYNVTVPADTTEVTISATPQSDKATVTVSGGKELKLGLNTAQVVVIAESGASRTYTITIMCGEKEQIQIDGTTKTIFEDFTDEQIPTGFTRTKVNYNKRQYEAVVNTTGNLHLMSLENEQGASFYIFNTKTQEFYTFVQVVISEGKYIVPLPLSSDMKQFSKNETVTISVNDKNFDAWKIDDEFSVAYVMNQDGENVLYRYDSVDGVFQRYTETELKVSDTTEKTLFPDQYYMYAIIGLGTLCVILLVALIYFIASRKKRQEGRKKKIERDAEKQRIAEEKRLEKEKRKEEKALEKQRRREEKELAKESGEGGGSKVAMWIMIILVTILVLATVVVVLGFFGIGIDFEVVWEEIKNML